MGIILNIFEKVVDMSLQASIAVAVVLLVRVLLNLIKTPKKFIYFIWIIPFIRLVCPFAFESPFSIMPKEIVEQEENEEIKHNLINNQVVEQDIKQPYEQLVTGYEQPDDLNLNEGEDFVDSSQGEYVVPTVPADVYEGEVSDTQDKGISLKEILSIFWLTGFGGIFIYSIISLVRFKKKLVGSVAISSDVYISDYIDTAFVIGFLKPRIYVPSEITDEEMEYVVAHERLHIKRFDYIVKPFAYFVAAFHWFNPVVWLAYIFMEKDMEMSCDEAVLDKLGFDKKKDYARALLKLSTDRSFVQSMPAAFAEGDTKGRVKNIMKIKKPLIVVAVVAIITLVILGVILLTDPKEKDKTTEGTDTGEEVYYDDTDIKPGIYLMQTPQFEAAAGNTYKYVPCLQIYEDGTVGFGYDPFSSYYPYAFNGYKVEDGKFIFTTEGDRTYTFTISQGNRLIFDAENSYDVTVVDENAAYPVVDGSIFVLTEEETNIPTEAENYQNYLAEYASVQEVNYIKPVITEDLPLGADGVILDYADENVVIYHGYAGLFIYDLKKQTVTHRIDLQSINAGMTQGDKTYEVQASRDADFVYIMPVSGPWAFSYDVKEEKLYQCPPDLICDDDIVEFDLKTSDCISPSGEGFYSYNCAEVSPGVYGYLWCPTGYWVDICYVESDMVFMLHQPEVDE